MEILYSTTFPDTEIPSTASFKNVPFKLIPVACSAGVLSISHFSPTLGLAMKLPGPLREIQSYPPLERFIYILKRKS